jgi:uncharacterized protein (DUF1015 family)
LRLIRQTESNDGLIFLLYRDASQQMRSVADSLQGDPLESVVDEYDTEHEIFRLDPAGYAALAKIFESIDLVIADGHHRFAVALQFMQECRAQGWRPAAPESFDKRLVALVEMSDPGLVILPTHRVVFGLPQFHFPSWERKMSSMFAKAAARDLPDLLDKLRRAGSGSFGVFAANEWAVWKRQRKPSKEELDVSILHEAIFSNTLGITEQQVAEEARVRYFRDEEKAAQDVKLGNAQLAFFLNPTRIEQVEACARGRRVMPQKSTDFFPKMLTGLLFMKMEIQK